MKSVRVTAWLGACVLVAVLCALAWSHNRGVQSAQKRNAIHVQEIRTRAENGDAEAQAELGSAFVLGRGVPQDDAEALLWYRRSANRGSPHGKCGLGWMYWQGRGVAQDYSQAIHWYKMGADQGSAYCESGLAYFYANGLGVPRDYREAVRLYRLAADQDYPKAEYNLGNMYLRGQGVAQDRAVGRKWLGKAAAQNDEYAKRAIGLKLTPWKVVVLVVQFLAGIALAFAPFSLNMWEPSDGFNMSRDWLPVGTGFLCLLGVALSWYGYTHNLIWCWFYGTTAFNLLKWTINAVVVISAFVLVFRRRVPAFAETNEL